MGRKPVAQQEKKPNAKPLIEAIDNLVAIIWRISPPHSLKRRTLSSVKETPRAFGQPRSGVKELDHWGVTRAMLLSSHITRFEAFPVERVERLADFKLHDWLSRLMDMSTR
ncbi:hypothetical protein MGYG_01800 [Nannizzia gypsea CBS 118893]|uniref:Uncharacterized protein n=1 Tax=Arthroderma gypseum (strain ATCC MYA-4604 / CBS 118893) TaxID=535722 RepID=E5R3I5_ARTGP|nr:hypothetical protein MGYG_01800 [Nannizzia gypsea CBS 118893]EFQ98784.1 hypothetical protein MGYG_01800 [Nannizzia gypsea CBS 118893]